MQIPNFISKYFNDVYQYLIPLDGLFVSFFFLFMLIMIVSFFSIRYVEVDLKRQLLVWVCSIVAVLLFYLIQRLKSRCKYDYYHSNSMYCFVIKF